jgi:hypothetical protein
MPFPIRPYRRFPIQCSVRYHSVPFLTLPLTYFLGLWSEESAAILLTQAHPGWLTPTNAQVSSSIPLTFGVLHKMYAVFILVWLDTESLTQATER